MHALDAHIANVRTSEGVKFTGVMVEYVLLSGVNDLEEHAHQLASLLDGKPVLINLIPYNPNVTAEMYGFKAPTKEDAYAFGKVLIDRGLHARVRIERGSDIAAACGQLALRSKRSEGKDGSSFSGGDGKKMSDIEDLFQGGSKSGSRSGGGQGVKARGGKARRREKKTVAKIAAAEAEKEKHLNEEPAAGGKKQNETASEEIDTKERKASEKTPIFGMEMYDTSSDDGSMWMLAAAVVAGFVVAQMAWRRS
jgi:hypothetical protein